MENERHFVGQEGLISKWISSLVVAGFLGLLLLGYSQFVKDMGNHPKAMALSWVFFALITFFQVRSALTVVHERAAKPAFFRIILLSIPILIALIFYVSLFSVKLSSDFAAYWDLAKRFIDGRDVNWGSVYDSRSRAMLSPVVSMFGYNQLSFKFANVFYLFTSVLLAGWIGYRCGGYRAAVATVLASSLCIAPFAWSLMPSHDIPGTMVFLLGMVYIIELCRLDFATLFKSKRPTRAFLIIILCSIGCGLALGWVQFFKASAPFYFVGGLIAFLMRGHFSDEHSDARQPIKTVARGLFVRMIFLSIPLIVATFAQNIVVGGDNMEEFDASASEATHFWIAAHTNSYGNGSHTADIRNFLGPYRPLLNQANTQYKTETLHTALANASDEPVGTVLHRLNKAGLIMSFSSQWGYINKPELAVGDFNPKRKYNISPIFAFAAHTFMLLVIMATLVILLSNNKVRTRGAIIVVPLVVMAGALIMLGQVQSRYIMPVWFLGASLVGLATASFTGYKDMDRAEFQNVLSVRSLQVFWTLLLTGITAIVGLVLFILAVKILYTPENGRPVYLKGNVSTASGGKLPSPYAFRATVHPNFNTESKATIHLPDSLLGKDLTAWSMVRLASTDAKDCIGELSIVGAGGDQSVRYKIRPNRATPVKFVGVKDTDFSFKKICDGLLSNYSFDYEIAFIRATP